MLVHLTVQGANTLIMNLLTSFADDKVCAPSKMLDGIETLDDDEEDQTLTVDEEAFKNQLQSVHDYDLANKTPGTPREGEEAAAAADDE